MSIGEAVTATSVPHSVWRLARPLTLTLSPSGGEGIETAPSPAGWEWAGVRVAPGFTHSPG